MIIFLLCRRDRLRLMRPCLSFLMRSILGAPPSGTLRVSKSVPDGFVRQRARVHCAHPWAQPCGRLSPCKLSVLTICPSTIQICLEQIWTSEGCPQGVRHGRRTSTTAMLSVAGTRWRKKSGAITASPDKKSGLEEST